MKGKQYIYEKLVNDDADIIGMLAYGIYKRHKIEFIESIRQQHDREPNEEERLAFAISTTTESQLENYLSQADTLLATFVMDTAGEQIKEAERKMLEQYQDNIKAVLPSNAKTVGLSILGSFIFSAVVTLALILGAFSEKDKAKLVETVVKEQVNVLPVDSITDVQPKQVR